MAALVAGGLAEPDEQPAEISLEEDEAERDAYFASLRLGTAADEE